MPRLPGKLHLPAFMGSFWDLGAVSYLLADKQSIYKPVW